jgi:hypothetical protein
LPFRSTPPSYLFCSGLQLTALSPKLAELVALCLEREPAKRPSMQDVVRRYWVSAQIELLTAEVLNLFSSSCARLQLPVSVYR